jgi:hypothetical protein
MITLYHGSPNKIEGEFIRPSKANGLIRREDELNGIYATRIKDFAILKAIISCRGVIGPTEIRLDGKRIKARVKAGKPLQEEVYIYTFNDNPFSNSPIGSHQYFSESPVKPLRVEKIKVIEYMHMIDLD